MYEELFNDSYGSIMYDPERGVLELAWNESTSEMSDEDFKRWLAMFAQYGEQYPSNFMIIDGRKFAHELSGSVNEWRAENILPRYNAAGIKKFAFLLPTGEVPDRVPEAEPGADFPTGYFEAREQIDDWFDS